MTRRKSQNMRLRLTGQPQTYDGLEVEPRYLKIGSTPVLRVQFTHDTCRKKLSRFITYVVNQLCGRGKGVQGLSIRIPAIYDLGRCVVRVKGI